MSAIGAGSSRLDGYAYAALGAGKAGSPVGAVLERVALLAKAGIPGVHEASVVLLKGRAIKTVGFTGSLAVHLDERQYEAGFGPSLDAAVSGTVIAVPDTARETRYRDFAAVAARQGITHTLAMGLAVGPRVVGGLNLYGVGGGGYDDSVIEIAETFAGHAAVAVANAAALADAVDEAGGLRTAMQSRAVIEQAKGILMRDHGCGPDEAFQMMVTVSTTTNRKLRDIAAALVDNVQH